MEPSRRQVAWIGGIAFASLLLTYISVDRLRLPRDAFVLCHVAFTGALLAAHAASSRYGWRELIGRWPLGLTGGVIVGVMMVLFVLQGPSSPRPSGVELVRAIAWLGVAYAMIDALLLSVFPVMAVQALSGGKVWTDGRPTSWAVVAFGICLLLTVSYHLGFPEFRGPAMASPLIGNGIMTLGYLATRSAITPILAHIGLHTAAVVFGYASALPAPPHY